MLVKLPLQQRFSFFGWAMLAKFHRAHFAWRLVHTDRWTSVRVSFRTEGLPGGYEITAIVIGIATHPVGRRIITTDRHYTCWWRPRLLEARDAAKRRNNPSGQVGATSHIEHHPSRTAHTHPPLSTMPAPETKTNNFKKRLLWRHDPRHLQSLPHNNRSTWTFSKLYQKLPEHTATKTLGEVRTLQNFRSGDRRGSSKFTKTLWVLKLKAATTHSSQNIGAMPIDAGKIIRHATVPAST